MLGAAVKAPQRLNTSLSLSLCTIGTVCANGTVRLQGGKSPQEGRVEFCYKNVWGTICDDNWDDNDARVVCRQLNFSDTGQ